MKTSLRLCFSNYQVLNYVLWRSDLFLPKWTEKCVAVVVVFIWEQEKKSQLQPLSYINHKAATKMLAGLHYLLKARSENSIPGSFRVLAEFSSMQLSEWGPGFLASCFLGATLWSLQVAFYSSEPATVHPFHIAFYSGSSALLFYFKVPCDYIRLFQII